MSIIAFIVWWIWGFKPAVVVYFLLNSLAMESIYSRVRKLEKE